MAVILQTKTITLISLLAVVFLLTLACQYKAPEETGVHPVTEKDSETGVRPIIEKDSETGWPIVEKSKVLRVEPYLSNCNCFHRQPCLVINGEKTCEGIRGFTHKEGVWTKLLVDVYKA